MHTVYFLIGGNLGNRKENLLAAIDRIEKKVGKVDDLSSVYKTEPWGFQHDKSFFNQVVKVKTEYSPDDVLNITQEIEKQLGRVQKNEYAGRTIDIDILFYDDWVLKSSWLTVPHQHLHKRMFALIPMEEIAPKLIHPVLKENVSTLKEICEDENKVELVE